MEKTTLNIQNQIRSISKELINNNDSDGINILMGITGSIDLSEMTQTQFNGLLNIFNISEQNSSPKKKKLIPQSQSGNYGFKVTNPTLETILNVCEKVPHNPLEHLTIRELGYESNYQLNKLGKKRLSKFQENGGKIFIQSDSENTRKNQVKYLFSKSQSEILKKGNTNSNKGVSVGEIKS
jgi:hypothetical protein